jgi:hypothetical protein
MFSIGNNMVVQALGKGLYFFDGLEFDFIEGSQLFGEMKVHAIVSRPSDHFWVCTDNKGIYQYTGSTFTPLNTPVSQFLKVGNCNAGLSVNDSLIVLGTILNGIVFCDGQGTILKTFNVTSGLNNNTVLSLFLDTEKGLWVGLDEGANYVNLDSPFRLFHDINGTLGTIYTVIRKDRLIYLGTNHGLFVGNILNNQGEYDFSDFSLMQNTQGQVWKLYEYSDQLLCGHNEGTFLIRDRNLRKISEVTGGYCFTGYHDLLLQD